MIQLAVEKASVDGVKGYLEQVRQRILDAVREGMQEAMEGLAGTVVDKIPGAGIKTRQRVRSNGGGDLISAIQQSPRVTTGPEYVRGTVSAEVGNKHLGLWLEEGFHEPAVEGSLFQFTTPDGDTLYSRGHRAFDVKPHPFMNPALESYKAPIMDIIAQRVAEAY